MFHRRDPKSHFSIGHLECAIGRESASFEVQSWLGLEEEETHRTGLTNSNEDNRFPKPLRTGNSFYHQKHGNHFHKNRQHQSGSRVAGGRKFKN